MRKISFKGSRFIVPEKSGYFVEILPVGEASRIYWVRNLAEADIKIKCCEYYNAIRGKRISSAIIYTDDSFDRVAVYNPTAKKEARWSLSFRDGHGKRLWQAFASLV